MKKYLLATFPLYFSSHVLMAQQKVAGVVVDENDFPLSKILVVNIQSSERTLTDGAGSFSIAAIVGNEIRLISNSHERRSVVISSSDLQRLVKIKMTPKFINIQEVKLKFQPTGNLKKDVSKMPKDKEVAKLEKKLDEGIAVGLDRQISIPRHRIPKSFNPTPILEGGAIAKFGERSSIMEISEWVKATLGEEYFVKFGIPRYRILNFIQYCLTFLDTKEIVEHGNYSQKDLMKLMVVMDEKKSEYSVTEAN